jgi:hypothetical protein
MTDFLTYLTLMAPVSTAELRADFALRRRTGNVWPGMPADDRELEAWLAALAKAGRIVEREGKWEATFAEVVSEGCLF